MHAQTSPQKAAGRPQNEEPSLHTVEANGLCFSYLEQGTGPLALLVHGFPDTPHGFAELMRPLADAGYRVVAPFTRGYAPTQLPAGHSTTLDDLAGDVLALIPALGHESAVLIGHDWGAATVYLAAGMAPERVNQLVAIGIPHPAAIQFSLGFLWAIRHFVGLRMPGALARTQRDDFAMIETYYRRWSPTWNFDAEETARVKACFSEPGSLAAAIGYYRGARPGVPSALRKKIATPTLAVAGADDPAVPVSAYENARRRFAGPYDVVALPGGHFVHRESPDGFRDALLGFLKPPPPPAPSAAAR